MVVAPMGSTSQFFLESALMVYAMAAKAILAASVNEAVSYVGIAEDLVMRINSAGAPASISAGNALFRSWIHEETLNPYGWVLFSSKCSSQMRKLYRHPSCMHTAFARPSLLRLMPSEPLHCVLVSFHAIGTDRQMEQMEDFAETAWIRTSMGARANCRHPLGGRICFV